jgi:hypothetical protein
MVKIYIMESIGHKNYCTGYSKDTVYVVFFLCNGTDRMQKFPTMNN